MMVLILNQKYPFIRNGEEIRNIDYSGYLEESIDLNHKFYNKLLQSI